VTLPELRTLLGRWRTIRVNGADETQPPIVASWECGCTAAGPEFTELKLRACAQHVATGDEAGRRFKS
jgi:hypothetical protein